jgi:predicted RNase H-like HicB family nuclease
METFEINISGSIIIQAETYDDAVAQLDQTLENVLSEWEIN